MTPWVLWTKSHTHLALWGRVPLILCKGTLEAFNSTCHRPLTSPSEVPGLSPGTFLPRLVAALTKARLMAEVVVREQERVPRRQGIVTSLTVPEGAVG